MEDLLVPGSSSIRPILSVGEAIHLARRLFGLGPLRLKELLSYDDRNFLLQEEESSNQYILKILNSLDSKKVEFIEAQNELLLYLNSRGIVCPKPVKNVQNTYYSLESIPGNPATDRFAVRLMDYIPGEMLFNVHVSDGLFYNVGEYIAQMDRCIQDNFHHPGFRSKKSIWMLESLSDLRGFLSAVDNEERQSLVIQVIEAFEKRVKPQMDSLEKGIIHGDTNEHNILVNLEVSDDEQEDDNNADKRISDSWYPTAMIDFGDAQYSCYIFELGIAAAYAAVHAARQRDANCGQALKALGHLVAGYLNLFPLKENELHLLQVCVCGRLAQSLVMGAYTAQQDPSNTYVLSSASTGWQVLWHIWRLPDTVFQHAWRDLLTASTPL